MVSAPSRSISVELALGAPQIAGELLRRRPRSPGTAGRGRSTARGRRSGRGSRAGDERRGDQVGFEDLDAVEAGRGGRVELVLERAGDADGGRRTRCAGPASRTDARWSLSRARTRTWAPPLLTVEPDTRGHLRRGLCRPVEGVRRGAVPNQWNGSVRRRPRSSGSGVVPAERWTPRVPALVGHVAPGRWVAGLCCAVGCARCTSPPGTAGAGVRRC